MNFGSRNLEWILNEFDRNFNEFYWIFTEFCWIEVKPKFPRVGKVYK